MIVLKNDLSPIENGLRREYKELTDSILIQLDRQDKKHWEICKTILLTPANYYDNEEITVSDLEQPIKIIEATPFSYASKLKTLFSLLITDYPLHYLNSPSRDRMLILISIVNEAYDNIRSKL